MPLPRNPVFKEGHWLLLRAAPLKTACPDGGHFLTEYDVCLRLAEGSARKLGRDFSAPLSLAPEQNGDTGRWDLRVELPKLGGGKFHARYHRIVGLALKETKEGPSGRPLGAPRLARPAEWSSYEVDHSDWNNLDCRLRNLQCRAASRHRGEGRLGWNLKKLSHDAKAAKVRKLLRRPAAAAR